MVHPSELLRTNSDGQRFSAPVGNYLNEVDCGIAVLPCLTRCLRLEKFAKLGVFVTVLSLVGFFHGAILNYFRGTSHIWSTHYNLSQETIDWFIYTNEIFAGIFALTIAYWGNRIHRATWIGGLTIFLAIASLILAAPEIYNPFSGPEIDNTVTGSGLCTANSSQNSKVIDLIQKEFNIVTITILSVYQMVFGMATVSFITHGITYIDDNVSPKHSPGFIGLVIAANEVGKQAGIYCSWAPYIINIDSIFLSPVWIVLGVLTFIMGGLIAMFPRTLPDVVMMKSVHSLISLASGHNALEEEKKIEGFFKSLWTVMKNKTLQINIAALMSMESALINFNLLQRFFNQSKYHVSNYNDSSGYSDPSLIQFTTNLLKQPMVAISVLTAGMFLAKIRPKAKYLVLWNIIAYILVALFFSSTVFWNCAGQIENEHKHSITIPYCSSNCGCSPNAPFQPVCVDRKTFFSPCLAGCRNFSSDYNAYQNCSCGQIVTIGSCDTEDCKIILAISQVNSILSSGLLATTLIGSLIINIRCVPNDHKAVALGFQYTMLGIIPYLPIRFVFRNMADSFCEIKGEQGCQFFSESFPVFLSTITILFMVKGIILAIVLYFLVDGLELYQNKNFSSHSDLEITDHRTDDNNTTREENIALDDIVESNVDDDERANDKLLRRRQMSEGEANVSRPKSKEDRISAYLSEGQLVPPLKPSIKRGETHNSKTSANSGLSSDSLKAIASTVGDDHDSESSFSEVSQADFPENVTKPKSRKEDVVVETAF